MSGTHSKLHWVSPTRTMEYNALRCLTLHPHTINVHEGTLYLIRGADIDK